LNEGIIKMKTETRTTVTLKLRRTRFALRTLALSVALLALLGLFATREARATETTMITITNNTNTTLTWGGITDYGSNGGWSDQEWASTCPSQWTAYGLGGPCLPCFVTAPPATIAAGQTVCFASVSTGSATNGTGGAMTYTINIPQEFVRNTEGEVTAVDMPTAWVAFAWTDPSLATGFPNGLLGTYPDANTPINYCMPYNIVAGTPPCSQSGNETYGAGLIYTSEAAISPDGEFAEFVIDQTAPTINPGAFIASGYGGFPVVIDGTGFDTNGYTQVFFGSAEATSVTCPTSTQCTAVAPPGSGTVPLTVSIFGVPSTGTSQFAYLPTASCIYGASSTTIGQISTECAPDAAQDPIYVFQQINGAWVYVYPYESPYYLLGGQEIARGVAVGTTSTYLGCTWNPSLFPSQTAWANEVTPDLYGCDAAPTSVTIVAPPSPPPPPPPSPASFGISSYPFWSGTSSSGTIVLSAAATASTPVTFTVSDPEGLGRATGVTIANTTVSAGQTSATFTVTASSAALPSVQLVATANGVSFSGTVQVATGAFVVRDSGDSLTLYFQNPTPSGSTVTFTDTDASVAAVASSVSLATGVTTASVPLTITLGNYGTTAITATYEGATFSVTIVYLAPVKVYQPPPTKCGDLPC
jgi:hypothetical protein